MLKQFRPKYLILAYLAILLILIGSRLHITPLGPWILIPRAYAQIVQQSCPNGTAPIVGPSWRASNISTDAYIQWGCLDNNGNLYIGASAYVAGGTTTNSNLQTIINNVGPNGTVTLTNLITISSGAGLTLTRGSNIKCLPGGGIKWAQATGSAITVGTTSADTSWNNGTIEGCIIVGNGGGSDTSICVQIGVPSNNYSVHGFHLIEDDIYNCGNGFVQTGNGDAFGLILERVKIHNNSCNGIRGDIPTTSTVEASSLISSFVFNNGTGQNSCTGIQVSPNSNTAFHIIATHIESNGNGTMAQIFCPSSGFINIDLQSTHMEHSNVAADTGEIEADSTGSNRSIIKIVNSELIQNPGSTANKNLILTAQADVFIGHSTFTQKGGASTTIGITVGSGGVGASLTMTSNEFNCSNIVATCQVISIPTTVAAYDISGTVLNNYGSVTTLININIASNGCHDLTLNIGGPNISGSRTCTGFLVASYLGSTTGIEVILGSDYTNSTTTPTAVFSFTLPATTTTKNYRYSCDMMWESTNTTLVGPVLGVNISAAPTQMTAGAAVQNTLAGADVNGYISNATTGSQTVVTSSAAGVTTTNYWARIWGTIEGAPTAGTTFIINAASTSGTTATLNIRRGSGCIMMSLS